jgi:SAM-dependent methyltransferase
MPTHIDYPAEENAVDRFAFLVVGWAWLGPDQHRIAGVEAWSGETLIGETDLLGVRVDVCAHLRVDASARTAFQVACCHATAGRGETFEVAIRVRFGDGSRTDRLATRIVRALGNEDPARAVTAWPSDEDMRNMSSATDDWPLPPEHLQSRQVGAPWGRIFYREGRVILNQIAQAFADAGKSLATARAILDFGCGNCRVLSAFADMAHGGDLWGCDIDAEAIAWNAAHLSPFARFEANPVLPPMRFADGQFDAIYSVSVFTHLPEDLQFVWLNELRRIIEPGGVLVASVHGGEYHRQADASVRSEVASRGFAYRTGQATAGLPDFYMLAYHSEWYLRSRWARFFELVGVREKFIHGAHDAVVLRRRIDER